MAKKKSWTKEQMEEAIKKRFSYASVLKDLNLHLSGGNYKSIKFFIRENNINIDHWKGMGWNRNLKFNNRKLIPLQEVLIVNSNYSTNNLKKRLITNGLLKNECIICKLGGEWNGKKIVHILDHINGVNNDNRIDNLRIVCPNCNSQLDTFAGRNYPFKNKRQCLDCGDKLSKRNKNDICGKCLINSSVFQNSEMNWRKKEKFYCRKVLNRPSKEELEKMVKEMPMTQIGLKYGVSDNAVRKWLK